MTNPFNTFKTAKTAPLLVLSTLLALSACQAPGQTPAQPTAGQSASPSAVTAVTSTIKVGTAPHGMAAAAGFVYNSNSGDNTISVIDSKTDAVVKTLTLSEGKPNYIKAAHDDKHIFVLNTDAGKLHVFNPAKDHALVQTLDVGKGPDKIQISADDRKAWLSLTGEASLVEIDFSQGLDMPGTVKKIEIGKGSPDGKGHRALALGMTAIVIPNPGDNDVSLVTLANGAHRRVTAGNNPSVVAFGAWDNADRMLIIGNAASNTVTLHHLETQISNTLQDVGQTPTDIAIVPELTRAFVTMSGSNEVTVIDYKAQKVLTRIAVGQRPVHIFKVPAKLEIQHDGVDHSEIWVGNDGGDSVSVIDPEGLKLKKTVAIGKGHHKMAFWSHKAYISNISDGTISVIDRSRLDQ